MLRTKCAFMNGWAEVITRSCSSKAVDGSTVVALSTACLERINRGRKPDRSTQCSLTATGYPPRLHVCLSFPNKMKKSISRFDDRDEKQAFVSPFSRYAWAKNSFCRGHRRNLQLDRTQWITQRAAEGGAQSALTGLRSTSVTVQLQTEALGPVVYYYRFKLKKKPEENGPLYSASGGCDWEYCCHFVRVLGHR